MCLGHGKEFTTSTNRAGSNHSGNSTMLLRSYSKLEVKTVSRTIFHRDVGKSHKPHLDNVAICRALQACQIIATCVLCLIDATCAECNARLRTQQAIADLSIFESTILCTRDRCTTCSSRFTNFTIYVELKIHLLHHANLLLVSYCTGNVR